LPLHSVLVAPAAPSPSPAPPCRERGARRRFPPMAALAGHSGQNPPWRCWTCLVIEVHMFYICCYS